MCSACCIVVGSASPATPVAEAEGHAPVRRCSTDRASECAAAAAHWRVAALLTVALVIDIMKAGEYRLRHTRDGRGVASAPTRGMLPFAAWPASGRLVRVGRGWPISTATRLDGSHPVCGLVGTSI